jgi:DNA-binding NtrC family response regulator
VILCAEGEELQADQMGLASNPVAAPAPSFSAASPATLSDSPAVTAPAESGGAEVVSLAELEKQHILRTLKLSDNNRTHAAKKLGISIRTLRNKLHEYGVSSREDTEAGE